VQGRGGRASLPAAMWSDSFSFSRGSAFGGVDSLLLCAAQHLDECLCRRPPAAAGPVVFWRAGTPRDCSDARMAERRTIRPGGSLRLSRRAVDPARRGNKARRVPSAGDGAGVPVEALASMKDLTRAVHAGSGIAERSLIAAGSAAAGVDEGLGPRRPPAGGICGSLCRVVRSGRFGPGGRQPDRTRGYRTENPEP